jgi:hypothetical protein
VVVVVVVLVVIQGFWYMDAVRQSKSLQSQEHLNLEKLKLSVFEAVQLN